MEHKLKMTANLPLTHKGQPPLGVKTFDSLSVGLELMKPLGCNARPQDMLFVFFSST